MLTKKQVTEKINEVLNHTTDFIYFNHPYGTGLINLQTESGYLKRYNKSPESKIKKIIQSFDNITDIEIIPNANIDEYKVNGSVLQVNITLKQREIQLGDIIKSPVVKNEVLTETTYSAYALIDNVYYPVTINKQDRFNLSNVSVIKSKVNSNHEIFIGKFEYVIEGEWDKKYLDFVSIMKYCHKDKKFIFTENNRLNMNIKTDKNIHI